MRTAWGRVTVPLVLLAGFLFLRNGITHRAQPIAAASCDEPHRSALSELERCVTEYPDDVESWIAIGEAYARSGQLDRSATAYRRALGVDPEDGDAHFRLGSLLLSAGDAAGARQEAKLALAVEPGRAEVLELLMRTGSTGRLTLPASDRGGVPQ